MRARQFMLGLVLSGLMGGGIAIGGYKLLEEDKQNEKAQNQNNTVRYSNYLHNSDVKVPEGLNFVAAAQSVTPAVVHVRTEYGNTSNRSSRRSEMMDPFLRDFFGDDFENYQFRADENLI